MDGETVIGSEETKNEDHIESIKLKNGSEIIIAGIGEHTTNLKEVAGVMGALDKCIKDRGAQNVVFLGEGSAVEAGITKESTEIAIFGGDQQAMARKAKELGAPVIDSWDMSLEEQISAAKLRLGSENALVWMISQSSISLRKQGEAISLENILSLLNKFELTKEDLSAVLGDPISSGVLENETSVDNFMKNKTGFTLSEVNGSEEVNQQNYRNLSQVANPGNTAESVNHLPDGLREASLVAGGLSKERNDRFVQKLKKYSGEGKTVFISCGGGHVDEFTKLIDEAEKTVSEQKENTPE